jgi:predicted nucleotidyltransferase
MNTATESFIEDLKKDTNVLGIILFGSWARGNNRPDSDVDLVVILEEGYRRTVEYKDGQAFEIIYTTGTKAMDFWKNNKDDSSNLWKVAKILYDSDGSVDKLREEIQDILKRGKEPINKHQLEQFRFSAEDTIKSVEVTMGEDPSTANLVLSKTVLTLTEQFFDVRMMWTPAPKQRLSEIKSLRVTCIICLKAFMLKAQIQKNELLQRGP